MFEFKKKHLDIYEYIYIYSYIFVYVRFIVYVICIVYYMYDLLVRTVYEMRWTEVLVAAVSDKFWKRMWKIETSYIKTKFNKLASKKHRFLTAY